MATPTVLIRITEDASPNGQVHIEQYVHDFEFEPGMTDSDLPPALLAAAMLLKGAEWIWSGDNKPIEGYPIEDFGGRRGSKAEW